MNARRKSPSEGTLRARLRERSLRLADSVGAPDRVDTRLVAKLAKARKLSWREERRHVRRVLRVAANVAQDNGPLEQEVSP